MSQANTGNNHSNSRNIKILHVDDDEGQLLVLKELLQYLDPELEVDSMNDPPSAIEKVITENYDCIVTDYKMPIFTGIEMAKEIRQFSNIPIILYTGQGSEEVAEAAFQVGVDDYIKKEMDSGHFAVLYNRIVNAVEKNRAQTLYHAVVESINDAIIILENDTIKFYNRAFKAYLLNHDVLGEKIDKILDADERKDFMDWLKAESSASKEFTLKIDDNKIYVIISKMEMNYLGKKSILLTMKDISQQKLIDDERKLSNSRLRALVNGSPDGIASVSLTGFVTYVNPMFCEKTGYSEDELLNKHILNIKTIRKRDLLRHISSFYNIARGGELTPIEFIYTRKDGVPGVGEAYPSIIDLGDRKEVLLILKDVTSFRREEAEYRNLFESAPDGIIHLDLTGRIVSINTAALKLVNLKKEAVVGRNIREYGGLLNLDLDVIEFLNDSVVKERRVEPLEVKIGGNTDHPIWVEAHVSLIEVDEEKLGIQIITRDITERKKIEEERLEYAQNLERLVEERSREIVEGESMVAIGKMASMIAHDLKGPLQVISNSLNLLRADPGNSEKFMRYIADAVNQSTKLINELSMHGKATPLNLTLESVDEVIEEALTQAKTVDNIIIKRDIKEIPKVRLDKPKFIRVFQNLFKNSVEAMGEGGELTVSAEALDRDVVIRIADTGVGIPEERLTQLFRPFQSTKPGGMGLGLMFCKKVIEEHGGSISIESEPGRGTTVSITLTVDEEMIGPPLAQEQMAMNASQIRQV